jgi:hypothetical protein
VCETTGDLPDKDLAHPVTPTRCADCGAILLINPDTGDVDAHKSPLRAPSVSETSGAGSTGRSAAVLSMRPKEEQTRDLTALVVIALVLIILIAAGVYLTISLDIV